MTDDPEEDGQLPDPEDPGYPIYEGDLDCCSHCGRQFKWGDLIAISYDEQLAFCFYDIFDEEAEEVLCQRDWVIKNKALLLSKPHRFGGE